MSDPGSTPGVGSKFSMTDEEWEQICIPSDWDYWDWSLKWIAENCTNLMDRDPRGYWRVTHWPNLGAPPHIMWFNYDDKDVAEILADESYKKLDWKKPIVELDMNWYPIDDDEDDEEEDWLD